MWIKTYFKSLTSTASRRRPTCRPASRLCVEALEDRWVPSFLPAVDYPVSGGVWDVVSADFNGDGRLDLATSAEYPVSKISVLLGNGDGTFQPARTSPGDSSSARYLAVGDFNGDGKPDLVNEGGVHLGNGDGTFGSGLGLPPDFAQTNSLAAGDLNADGKYDLVGIQTYSDGWSN